MKKKINNYIHIIAGAMIIITLLFSHYYNQNWLWVTGFIGLNLFQYGITGFCPMAVILKKFGFEE